MTTTIQMRAKGSITLPSDLRQKYALEEGDVFSLIDLGDGSFALVPRISIVPKLVGEIETLREEAGLSLDALLEGLSEERRKLYEAQQRESG
jgi:bifunctional DNA-binding transcriptional regulator/antitoxin component of YhaV-PrlF toxin-antitoxin module